jgi:hypothetical protein
MVMTLAAHDIKVVFIATDDDASYYSVCHQQFETRCSAFHARGLQAALHEVADSIPCWIADLLQLRKNC